ncbi:unnamed protein product [Cyclocybe aegerita]|uniref:Serine aminopeptidase S33 domain-containing protein n=1 Tax=Cyclocybe aegerita TaxID=1973307 RepID=A0A8S0WCF6_CYCAE|nr:unnamed protein product [Cyclocybe aegerita]
MFFRLWTRTGLPRTPFPLSASPLARRLFSNPRMSTSQLTEAWLEGPQSTKFYTRTYTPSSSAPKAALVFVHGFAEHIARYSHFHPLLAEKGVAVFAYDQRGFGQTAQDSKGNKSKTSAYGKTSWKEQMADIEWALEHVKKSFEGVPLFLMGHSMGGAEALGFATQGEKSPHALALKSVCGVISTSPLVEQTTPASKILRFVGGKLSALLPSFLIPAPVNPQDLSHDKEVGAAYLKDPLVREQGSLKGIHDMLSKGETLLQSAYAHWPKELPVLLIHGTEDKVTSHKASQSFHDKIDAVKKKIVLMTDGFHELHNEPDAMHKVLDEVVAFIEDHLPSSSAKVPDVSAAVSSSTPEAAPAETASEKEPSVKEQVPKEAESSTPEPAPPTEAGIDPTGVGSARAKM